MGAVRTFCQMVKCLYVNKIAKTQLPKEYEVEEELIIVNDKERVSLSIPKIIWMYWEDEKVPNYIYNIVNKVVNLNKDHNVHFLNKVTISEYLPDLIITGDMPLANKSDIIRLELLYRYGGIWIDSTTVFRDGIGWVHQVSPKGRFDIIGYYREKSTTDTLFPIVESWFLACAPQNELVRLWLKELDDLKEFGNIEYFNKIKSRSDYSIIKQNISTPSYLLVYLAGQIALRKYSSFNLFLKKCESHAFFLQEFYNWDNYKINYAITQLETPMDKLSIVKLTSGDRMLIKIFSKFGFIKRKSLMWEFTSSRYK
ncbi:capsular polysaccharide synthesis protein [Elizabethkingia meningoseptica]